MTRWKYTREILQEAVDASVSVAGVLRYLEVAPSGGSHAHISRSIKALGISTSHFTGQGWNKGKRYPNKRPPEHYLRMHELGSPRVKGHSLRRAMLKIGRVYECAMCRNDGSWMGYPLTLHVDHINGNYFDCRAENLRFLCPNCHSQTSTHAGRNKGLIARLRAKSDRPF